MRRKNPQRFVIVPERGERWIYDTLSQRFVAVRRGRGMNRQAVREVNERNDRWMRES